MMDEKRLLILGSGEDFEELTKRAVQRGIYTVVVDGFQGCAKSIATKAYTVDIADKESIDLICKTERIDHVLSSFSDNLFEQMVYISERNNLPCFCKKEKVRYLRDKLLMKEMLKKLNIPTAKAQVIDLQSISIEKIQIEYPFVLKPSDGWGSKGMRIIHTYQELADYMKKSATFSTSGVTAMIETINKGYEINVMSWIKDGNVYLIEYGDRETSGYTRETLPYLSREVFPSYFYDELKPLVIEYLKKIADFIGIKEGPLSMQVFWNGKTLVIGEVAGRFFGLGQGIVPVINGINLNDLLLNMIYSPDANNEILQQVDRDKDHYSIAIYLKALNGVVRDLGNVFDFVNHEAVDEFKIYAEVGKSTKYIPWIARVYGHFSSRAEADSFTRNIYDNLFVPNLDGENLVAKNKLIEYEEM